MTGAAVSCFVMLAFLRDLHKSAHLGSHHMQSYHMVVATIILHCTPNVEYGGWHGMVWHGTIPYHGDWYCTIWNGIVVCGIVWDQDWYIWYGTIAYLL